MVYLAEFYALYLARNSNFRSETLYRDSRRLVESDYVKNAISTNRYNVRILTSAATNDKVGGNCISIANTQS